MKNKKNDIILISAFSFLVISIIVITLVGSLSLRNTKKLFDQAYNTAFKELTLSQEMNTDIIALHRVMKDVALARTATQLTSAITSIDTYNLSIENHFKLLGSFSSDNQLLDEVIAEYKSWEPIRAKTIEFARNGKYEAAAENTRTICANQVSLINSKVQALLDKAKNEAVKAYNSSNEISRTSIIHLIFISIFIIFLSLSISIMVRKRLKNYENYLIEQKNKLQITFDSIGDGVITTDVNRNVIGLNRVAENYTGWKIEDAYGKPFSEVFNITNEYTGNKAKDPVEEVLALDKICELENHTILTSKDGTQKHIADSAAPIKNHCNVTIGVVMIFRDVTEKKQLQKELLESEEHYRMLYNSMLNGYALHEIMYDQDGNPIDYNFVDINPAFEEMTGLIKSEVVGKSIKEIIPETEDYWINTYGEVVTTGKPIRYENFSEAFNKYFEVYAFTPKENHFAVLIADITERKRFERESNNSRVLLDSSIESAKDFIIYSIDNNFDYLYFNKNLKIIMKNLYNVNVEIGMNALDCTTSNEDRIKIKVNLERALNGESHSSIEEFGLIEKSFYETSYNPIYNDNNEIIGATAFSKDISERKKREEEIIYLNYHDVLTGLYNRAYFEKQKELLDKEENLPISVIWGDINGLKLINDGFGHEAGDRLLIEISKILKSCCREQDILSRIGGDEFSIILTKTASEEAQNICRKIYKACEQDNGRATNRLFKTSISLGYSTKINPTESIEAVSNYAEEVMYRKKLLDGKSMHSSLINSMKSTMSEKSFETEQHAERLINLAKPIGEALKLDEEQLNELELLSTLHDIGKMSISDNVLNKPGGLTDSEWFHMKKHPEVGYRIAMATTELAPIAEYILSHHERWDGKGYPQGLKGKDIPVLSRILSVVDSFDAMTNDRPYRKGMPIKDAIAEIKKNAGTQFDPEIADIFIEKIGYSEVN